VEAAQARLLRGPQWRLRSAACTTRLAVSPDGGWFAGKGASLSPYAYVLSTDGRTCLVVPGRSVGVQGFTRDSKAVIILRAYKYPKTRLIQYPFSTLRAGCPSGNNGVLPQKR
jgi:hypothetical protein